MAIVPLRHYWVRDVCSLEQLRNVNMGLKQGEPHKEAIVPQGQSDIYFKRCTRSSDMYICTVVTSHLPFWNMTTWWMKAPLHVFQETFPRCGLPRFRSELWIFPSTPHILSLINKVAAVQISRLYLMSTSTPGLGLILSLCFETDGYYYNKKVANYFSSRRQKQLTTGIMCWLKSIPVSMKGEKTLIFHSVSWRTSTAQSTLTLTRPQLSGFFDLIRWTPAWRLWS